MNKKLMVIGIVLIFIGAILVAGFWPLIGETCQAVENSTYSPGDSVIIYGEIKDMRYFYSSLIKINGTVITLEGDFDFWVENKDVTNNFEKGDQVYASVTYKQVKIGGATLDYWSASEVNSTSSINLTFFTVIIIGAVFVMVGAVVRSKPRKS